MCCISFIAIFLFFSLSLSAQELSTDPVYQRGATVLEQTLPPSPEAASRTRYTDAQIGYSSTLSRWMAPDPLSEKYYGISPYAYCGGNPMAAVDKNGKLPSSDLGTPIYATHPGKITRIQHFSNDEDSGGSRVRVDYSNSVISIWVQ